MEGDSAVLSFRLLLQNFNPLPPHGGRRCTASTTRNTAHFNPLPPHGGRLQFVAPPRNPNSFQSTPSAWRETTGCHDPAHGNCISIHSLRMEGDLSGDVTDCRNDISIHSLRMEGDRKFSVPCSCPRRFQSTPSAWRETRIHAPHVPL